MQHATIPRPDTTKPFPRDTELNKAFEFAIDYLHILAAQLNCAHTETDVPITIVKDVQDYVVCRMMILYDECIKNPNGATTDNKESLLGLAESFAKARCKRNESAPFSLVRTNPLAQDSGELVGILKNSYPHLGNIADAPNRIFS